MVALVLRQPPQREARIQRADLTRLLAMAGFGAVLGPVALAWGLQRTSGSSASLMLTLEAVFTAVLAWKLYGETMDRRVGAAMLFLLAGGASLVLEQGLAGSAQLLGLLAVLVATAAWGVDNSLSRGVAERDPGQVVLVKAGLGALATLRSGVGGWRANAASDASCGLVACRRKRLWTEPSPVPVCAAGVRCWSYGFRLRLCAIHRCLGRSCPRRPFLHLVDGSGWRAHGGRRHIASFGIARSRARPRSVGA